MHIALVWFLPHCAIQPPATRDVAPQGRRGSVATVTSMSLTLVEPVFESPKQMIMEGPMFESPEEIFMETAPHGNVPLSIQLAWN